MTQTEMICDFWTILNSRPQPRSSSIIHYHTGPWNLLLLLSERRSGFRLPLTQVPEKSRMFFGGPSKGVSDHRRVYVVSQPLSYRVLVYGAFLERLTQILVWVGTIGTMFCLRLTELAIKVLPQTCPRNYLPRERFRYIQRNESTFSKKDPQVVGALRSGSMSGNVPSSLFPS